MNTLILDTNVWLSFFLEDRGEQHEKAKQLLYKAKQGQLEVLVPQIVVFELHFALEKYYGFEKSEVIAKIESILGTKYLRIESEDSMRMAISLYSRHSISFVDCFLIAKADDSDAKIFSFDKKLIEIADEFRKIS